MPEGLLYLPDFLDAREEDGLLANVRALQLAEARYKGYTAKRRTASFGSSYDFERNALDPAPDLPAFLLPLRAKVAARAGVAPERFAQALVTEYRPGTQLGWHRDVPQFDLVAGVSLGHACRMRFRRYPPRKGEKALSLELEPRSLYLLRGDIRWRWQHSVPPVSALRYSITFRTSRILDERISVQ